MKQILSLTLALALVAALFTGCACSANVSTEPNGMITEEATRPTVMPTPTETHGTGTQESQNTLPTVTGSDPTGESSSGGSGSGGGSSENGGTGGSGGSGSMGGSGGSGGTGGNTSGGNGSMGGSTGGSGGTNGGTGSNEGTMPTDTTEQRGRTRNTTR